MANKDFRARLREQETPYNPEAWAQMQDMLEAMPMEREPSRRMRRLLPLALLLLLLVVFGIAYLSLRGGHPEARPESAIVKQPPMMGTSEEAAKHEDTTPTPSVGSSSYLETATTPESSTADTERLKGSQPIVKNDASNQKYSAQAFTDENGVSDAYQTVDATSSRLLSNTAKPVDLTREDAGGSAIAQPQDEKTENVDQRTDDKGQLNQPNASSSSALTEGLNAQPLLLELLLLQGLRQEALSSMTDTDEETWTLPQIEPFSERKLFLTGDLGASDINSNRGYFLGAGLFWDIDKILGLEPTLSFSSASDIANRSNSFFDDEQELDLSLWIHLSFWRTARHKASLELAPSVGGRWGALRGEPGEWRGVHVNYKAGLSYTYFMNNDDGLGLKFSFSRFDSAFLTLRYYKNI